MKFYPILALCLFAPAVFATTYDADDVVLKDRLFFDKNNQPITGEIIKKYPSGKTFARFTIKDGASVQSELYTPKGNIKNKETQDHRTEFWSNGNIRRESIGDRAKGNDIRKFYTGNGTLLLEIPFENKEINGIVKVFAADGSLQEERPYIITSPQTPEADEINPKSMLHGTAKTYDKDKNLLATTDYNKGIVQKITHYDLTGNALPTLTKDSTKPLDEKSCIIDDKSFSGALIVNSMGDFRFFEVPCQNGVIDGTVRAYLGTYNKSMARVYDMIPFKNNKKNGHAHVFEYADLLLSGEVPYAENQVNGTVYEYLESGELLYETPYINNQINGTRKVYGSAFTDPLGDTLMAELPYTNNEMNGIATLYDKLGNVTKKITFLFGKQVYTKEY